MMKRKLAAVFAILLIGLFFLSTAVLTAADNSDEEQEPPDEIVISNEGYRQDRKGPVTFTHLNHAEDYDVSCKECHHDYDEGKNIWEMGDPVTRCVECHDPLESDGNLIKLMLAYHRNCIGCHKKLVKEGISEEAPYKKCYQCHEKKSR
ncbi:MAG: cytochrome c3 family protein [Deltaproteobacteria bacterium]|nr:cytochrome c3 family protein [Deltaproteobacteria bacterium]